MRFTESEIAGCYVIDLERKTDARGYFARTRCEREFAQAGLVERMVQDSIAYNARAHTLRGMHFFSREYPQTRLMRCIAGRAHVVLLDLRRDSPGYLRHQAIELDAIGHRALYVGLGVALGYQTLVDETVIFYQMPRFFEPDFDRGVRWDDPAFGIDWPAGERIMNERDAQYADYEPGRFDW